MSRRKISIIGGGNVGGTTAQRLAEKNLADVVLLDINEGVAKGKALDIMESASLYGFDVRVEGTAEYDATGGSDLVVISSGVPRKPGMSRDDLLRINAEIVRTVTREVAKRSPNAVIIVVSNPLDAMTYVAYRESGFPRERVVGMAGALDSARLRTFIAMELGVSITNVHALVLGGHGDTMLPLKRYTTVNGIPVDQLMAADRLDLLIKRTREGGAEIVNLLKTGSAYYAPSAAVVEMATAILSDQQKIVPSAAYCQGEYGIDGLFVGVPARLGAGGVKAIVEVELTPAERALLAQSAAAVRELCEKVDAGLQ
ncbi:MAG: malate dehydrogenase [Nitrospiria bacterium]